MRNIWKDIEDKVLDPPYVDGKVDFLLIMKVYGNLETPALLALLTVRQSIESDQSPIFEQ